MRQFERVNSRYGAPMGRSNNGHLEDVEPRGLRLFKVRLDSGGYDDGGAYWGHGGTIWCARDDNGFFATCRAGSRERAALELGIAPDCLNRLTRPLSRRRLADYVLATLDGRAPRGDGWSNASASDALRACGAAV